MSHDQDLLHQYVRQASRPALDELIRRHLDLVHSSALRDPHLAEDVTQAVFLILAQKAQTIRHGVALGGWLLSVTRHASVNAMKKQATRTHHEFLAARPETAEAAQPDADWNQVAPLLDKELNRLPGIDRDAVVLRFFQERTFAQVGEELGLSEAAAKKRVQRALERLRGLLSRRGVSLSAAAIGVAVTGRAAQAAPMHLLAAATAAIAAPPAAPATILGETLHMMAWANAKLIGSIAAAFLLVVAAVVAASAITQHVAASSDGSPKLIQDFQANYPAAAANLEEAYSHVRILARESRTNAQTGQPIDALDDEFLRDGNSVRGEQTVLDATNLGFPAGSFKAFGGDSANFFHVFKIAGQSKLNLDWSGPKTDFEMYVHTACLPLYAPYCVLNTRLTDYLKLYDRHVVSAASSTLDGADVIEIVVEATVNAKKYHDHFYFLPDSWALGGWTLELNDPTTGQSFLQARITYQPGSRPPTQPPIVKTVQRWMDGIAPDTAKKLNLKQVEVDSVQFGTIPAAEFTLGAMGLK
jgi:RNA polymerase sigma factor (sigma-70 family)